MICRKANENETIQDIIYLYEKGELTKEEEISMVKTERPIKPIVPGYKALPEEKEEQKEASAIISEREEKKEVQIFSYSLH